MSPYSHLSSESLLKLAEENINSSDARSTESTEYALVGIGQSLIVVARELIKLNWESNYESNMDRIREEHEGKEAK